MAFQLPKQWQLCIWWPNSRFQRSVKLTSVWKLTRVAHALTWPAVDDMINAEATKCNGGDISNLGTVTAIYQPTKRSPSLARLNKILSSLLKEATLFNHRHVKHNQQLLLLFLFYSHWISWIPTTLLIYTTTSSTTEFEGNRKRTAVISHRKQKDLITCSVDPGKRCWRKFLLSLEHF